MKPTNTIAKNRTETKASVSTEISKVSVSVVGITAGLIGCWATACLIGGLINSGGPVGLAVDYVTAVLG